MAGENIQLAQNTATDAGIPPADPAALGTMPGDTGDLGTTDLTGTGNDFPLDTLPDSGTTPPPDTLPANEAENPYGLAALKIQIQLSVGNGPIQRHGAGIGLHRLHRIDASP